MEKNEMVGICSAYEVGGGVYRVLVVKPKAKRPLGRHTHDWKIILD
jgi:hypothetical protein